MWSKRWNSNQRWNLFSVSPVSVPGRSESSLWWRYKKESGHSMTMVHLWFLFVKLFSQMRIKLWVCGHYSVTVNPQLDTHNQPLLLPDDLVWKLSGGDYFTKIDLANAYNMIWIAPETPKRLALTTHRGVLLQTRLRFGISSAHGYFQIIMERITCKGVRKGGAKCAVAPLFFSAGKYCISF